MALIHYLKLRCDWCGVHSPELNDDDAYPKIWKTTTIHHFCCKAHQDAFEEQEKTQDEW